MVPLEAILHNKPIVVTQCGGIEEWFSSDMGRIVPIKNDCELEKALRKMLDDYQTWDLTHAIQKVRSAFSEKVIGQKLFDFYS
jgi:glycosyltransferase involved in cell wall biosynthesis